MKKNLILFFIFYIFSLIKLFSQQKNEFNTDSLIYVVINKYCKDNNIKKINKIPSILSYLNEQSKLDSNVFNDFFNYFIDIVNNSDTPYQYIKEIDYPFVKYQILNSKIQCFERKKLNKIKFKRSLFGINTINISIPIFTANLNTAIFTSNCNGISYTILYQKNQVTNEWEYITTLYRSGT